MSVTVADFKELAKLSRPQLLPLAVTAGASMRQARAQLTDDALRLLILRHRASRK